MTDVNLKDECSLTPDIHHQVAGIVLIVCSLLSVALIAHHPTVGSHGFHDFLEEVKKKQSNNQIVHGSVMAILFLFAYSVSMLATALGTGRGTIRLGLIGYILGILAMMAAALVSGFIVPTLADHYVGVNETKVQIGEELFSLLRSVNRCCDLLGVMSMLSGAGFLSCGMLSRRSLRCTGGIGILIAAAGILGLSMGYFGATVHGVLAFVILITVWHVLISVHLIRGIE